MAFVLRPLVMRKLIFQQFLSLDGYAADAQGTTQFFESPEYSNASDDDLLKEMERFDLILLGRKTYELFAGFWPSATNDEQIVADKLNSIPKMVFSNTLKKAPWGNWPEASITAGDAVTGIQNLKQQNGKDMVLWGSISLSQALIRENLVDEYHIRIVPVLLGEGIPQFNKSVKIDLKLTKSKTYDSGLVLLQYTPR
jgi:dihydrofolate reductase